MTGIHNIVSLFKDVCFLVFSVCVLFSCSGEKGLVIKPEYKANKGNFPCSDANSGNIMLICETGFSKDSLTVFLNGEKVYRALISSDAKTQKALDVLIEKRKEEKSIIRLKINKETYRLLYKQKYCYIHLNKLKSGYHAIGNSAY